MVKKTLSHNSIKKKNSENKKGNLRYELRSNASKTSNLSRLSNLNNLKFSTMRSIRNEILNSTRSISKFSNKGSQKEENKSNSSNDVFKKQLRKAIRDNERKINYKLNYHLELKHNKTKTRFLYNNQAEYELISKYINDVVKYKLLKEYGMKILWVPNVVKRGKKAMNLDHFEYDKNGPQADIYVTEDFLDKNKKLLCLIQGCGDIRAGIWERSVCINENLNVGSVLPYVKMAKERNMQVIIFNPNERTDPISREEIKEFSSMEKHCKYVWQEIIGKLNFSNEVYVVAHSEGGVCMTDILADGIDTDRISKIAFTDLLNGSKIKFFLEERKKLNQKLEKRMINFIASDLNAGEFISSAQDSKDFVYNFSAGHVKHEYTTGCAIKEIFKFFEEQGDKYINDRIKLNEHKKRKIQRENKIDLDDRKEKPLEKIYEVISSSEDEEESEDKNKVNILLVNNSISDNIGIDFDYDSNNNDIEREFKNSIKKSRLNSSAKNELIVEKNLNNNNLSLSISKANKLAEDEIAKINFLKDLEKMACSHLNKNKNENKDQSKILSSNDNYYNLNQNLNAKFEQNENKIGINSIDKIEKAEEANEDYSNISVEGSNVDNSIEEKIKAIEENPNLNINYNNNEKKEKAEIENEIILNPSIEIQKQDLKLKNTNINDIIYSKIQEENKNLNFNFGQVKNGSEMENKEKDEKDIGFNDKKDEIENYIKNFNKPRIVLTKQQVFNSSRSQRNYIKNN